MATAYLHPWSKVQYQFSPSSPEGSIWGQQKHLIRQPTAPTETWTVDDSDAIGPLTVVMGRKKDIADFTAVTQIKIWVYSAWMAYDPENPVTALTGNIYVDGAWQTAQDFLVVNSWGWYSVTFNGSWDQADLDGLKVKLTNAAGYGVVNAQALYCEVTADATTHYYDPIATEGNTGSWTTAGSQGGNNIGTLSKRIVSPTDPSTGGISTPSASTDIYGMESVVAGSITKVKIWVSAAYSFDPADLKVDIYMAGNWIGEQTFDLTDTRAWYSYEYSGSWTQANIDALQVKLISVPGGSGDPITECFGMYAEITYSGVVNKTGPFPVFLPGA